MPTSGDPSRGRRAPGAGALFLCVVLWPGGAGAADAPAPGVTAAWDGWYRPGRATELRLRPGPQAL
ncbi:MAG: hypothetical protein KDE22_13100, partial [Rhodobacterales bacterium]|nr:hypothetical protein [Rhodobacterales bacterium]